MIIETWEYPFHVWHILPDGATPDEIQCAKGQWPPDRMWDPVGRPRTKHYLDVVGPGIFRLLEE